MLRATTFILCVMFMGLGSLWGQYSPPGAPRYHVEQYAPVGNGFDYLFLGLSRLLPPFYLPPTNMLLNRAGELVWYQQESILAMDLKVHPNGLITYSDNVKWHILDSNFVEVDSVACVGYRNDPHDIQMTADGHYFLICIEDTILSLSTLLTVDGSPGAFNARVDGVVIQELDGAKNVVQEWHGLQHYSILDVDTTYFTNPTVLELNHTNSIDLDGNGHMLLSHRALNEITLIDWPSGDVLWHLGGKLNEFDLQGDTGLKGQHDARFLPGGRISTFDNGNLAHDARGLVYAIDTMQMRATIEAQFTTTGAQSDAMGSFRTMPDGNGMVGFGRQWPPNAPIITYYAADSTPIMNIYSLDSCSSYRARPATLPFELHRPQLTCEVVSGQVILGVDGLHSAFQWTTGENSATIVVADTGLYQAFVPRGIGMMSTPAIHITDLGNACTALPVNPTAASHGVRKSLGVWDLLGRRVMHAQTGQVYVERFSDGSSRKFVWMQ